MENPFAWLIAAAVVVAIIFLIKRNSGGGGSASGGGTKGKHPPPLSQKCEPPHDGRSDVLAVCLGYADTPSAAYGRSSHAEAHDHHRPGRRFRNGAEIANPYQDRVWLSGAFDAE